MIFGTFIYNNPKFNRQYIIFKLPTNCLKKYVHTFIITH